MIEETYVLEVWPLGQGEDDGGRYPEILKYGEGNFGEAVQMMRQLIGEHADSASELWAAPAESPRTLYGDRFDPQPYLDAAYNVATFAAAETDQVTLDTHLEWIQLRREEK